ncbi:MAG: SAP domain-containing protein [Deltaproteobacteria bacterium]|nr:SAP domain-containing protein [Deltaproteobacteria bacterium]
MQMEEIRQKAKTLGIKATGINKTELVRAIQGAEGNFPCFATAKDYCDQLGCCFRGDCLEREDTAAQEAKEARGDISRDGKRKAVKRK